MALIGGHAVVVGASMGGLMAARRQVSPTWPAASSAEPPASSTCRGTSPQPATCGCPSCPGPRPLRVRAVNAYVARVQAAAASDPAVGLAFLRVANLLDRPEALLRPAVAARVVAARWRAAGPRRVRSMVRLPALPRSRRPRESVDR